MSFRFEMWTPPTALTFQPVIEDMLAVSGQGTIELSAYAESTVEVPREVAALPGYLVGVYDGVRWIDDMLIQRINRSVDREGNPTKTLSGVQVNGLASLIGVYPADHPTSPSVNREWVWTANPHEIVSDLLAAAQGRGTALWLDLRSTVLEDALGLAWAGDVSVRAGPPQSLADVLATLRSLGVNWEIIRKTEPEPPLTHDLYLYGPGSARNRTGGDVIINAPAGGEVIDRLPEASVRLALGAGGIWAEEADTPLLAAFGRWERSYDDSKLLDTAALTDFLDEASRVDEHNRLALQATIRQDDQIVPLRDFRPGDIVPWQLPGLTEYVERPVQTISWEHADTCIYQVTGSRVYDAETAMAEAVTELLDKVESDTSGGYRAAKGNLSAVTFTNTGFLDLDAVTGGTPGSPISVTLVMPYTGTAQVTISARLANNATGGVTVLGFRVSGATTIAATDADALSHTSNPANEAAQQSWVAYPTLNAGVNVIELQARVSTGTGNVQRTGLGAAHG